VYAVSSRLWAQLRLSKKLVSVIRHINELTVRQYPLLHYSTTPLLLTAHYPRCPIKVKIGR